MHTRHDGRGQTHAGTRMPAPLPFLVYRDRIGAPSEIGFLRRQYIGFTRLDPVWCGRTLRGRFCMRWLGMPERG